MQKTSSSFTPAKQPALTLEYRRKIFQSLQLHYQQENIATKHLPLACINARSKPDDGEDQLPKHPKTLPFPWTETNINGLKDLFLEHFTKTAYKNNETFPPISGPTTHIHLKEGAIQT